MVSSMYTVEAGVLIGMVALLWPLYLAQILALRFTPRRRWIPIKIVMLATGVFGTATLTIRMVDPSSVFGHVPVYVNSAFSVQATAAAFVIAASWLVASARSLHAQIQQPMPRLVTPALYGSALAFQLIDTSLIVAQSQMMRRPEVHSEWDVNRLDIALDIVLDAQTAIVFVGNAYLYLRLRSKIATFIHTLQQQEDALARAKQQQPAAAGTATTSAVVAASAPVLSITVRVQSETTGATRSPTAAAQSSVPVASVSSSSPSSASSDRVRELVGALRKMTIMSFLVALVCVGTIGNSVPRLGKLFQGIVDKRDLYGPDPESWSFGKLLPICLHFLTFLVTSWYVWLSPAVWMSGNVRRAHHTPFWRTLLHGVKDGPNTYAAPSRHEEQKRQQQTKKGAQAKSVTVAPAAGVRVAPAPAAAVAAPAAHQPGTHASSLRPSPPPPAVPSDHAAVGVNIDSVPLRQHDSSRQHAWPSGAQPSDAM